jgi:hypothetical protein
LPFTHAASAEAEEPKLMLFLNASRNWRIQHCPYSQLIWAKKIAILHSAPGCDSRNKALLKLSMLAIGNWTKEALGFWSFAILAKNPNL